ncbi:MAG: LPXTG cell wall anchor domain-containing protein, partial [Ruminococcus bromii]|nr:LPXTG cell wall anchor domain-containing protein [Ruminococcus bromii]
TVYGTAADGTSVTGTKTVQVSPEHIFVDGVCGCGVKQQYVVEYIGSIFDPICVDFKTYGEDLTLRGETFKREGYVQTGWVDEHGAVYDLGDLYTTDADMTFYPYFEKLITLTVPYTTTVALGDAGEPDETTFELALIDGWGEALVGGNVEVTAAVTTDGAGDYDSALTITGPEWTLWYMLSEGAFVQQVDAGADGWTVDDTVWGLFMSQVAELSDDAATGYDVYVVPASLDDAGRYMIDWESIDWENLETADMCFTNTYTKSIAKPTEPPETNSNTDKTTSPQTGDNRNPALWFALLAVSAAGVIGTGVYSKRRRSSRAK